MASPGVSQQAPSGWSSSDRHRHQPTTSALVPVPVEVPISSTPQEPYYYTQSQPGASPPPIVAYEPRDVLDLSIDPGTYIAYSAGYYSQDQYTAQQHSPTQRQQHQSAQAVPAYPRGQQARQPSHRGAPSRTNPIVLTQRQAVQQSQLQQQASPSTPGMYSSSSTSSPTPSIASFEGNILFWTSESHPVFSFLFSLFHSCLGLGSHSPIFPFLTNCHRTMKFWPTK
jgi:hypothetical protein